MDPGWQLEFRHECQHHGCRAAGCALCQSCQCKRCLNVSGFKEKYIVSDSVTGARCDASIEVVVVDHQTGKLVTDHEDFILELCILHGSQFDALGEAASHSHEALRGCELLNNKEGKRALLDALHPASHDEHRRVLVTLQERGRVTLPKMHVCDSCEALMGGRQPPVRLCVRAVHPLTKQPLQHVAPLVSPGFVVVTTRALPYMKVEIPLLSDSIKKVNGIGASTEKKLVKGFGDLQLMVSSGQGEIRTVGDLCTLIQRADRNKTLRDKLKKLLTDKVWDSMVSHVLTAVDTDTRLRVWYRDSASSSSASSGGGIGNEGGDGSGDRSGGSGSGAPYTVGLVFRCGSGNRLDLDNPVGLLRRCDPPHDMYVDIIWGPGQVLEERRMCNELKPLAVEAWKRPSHPGWALLPLDIKDPALGDVNEGGGKLAAMPGSTYMVPRPGQAQPPLGLLQPPMHKEQQQQLKQPDQQQPQRQQALLQQADRGQHTALPEATHATTSTNKQQQQQHQKLQLQVALGYANQQLQGFVAQQWQPGSVPMVGSPAQLQQQPMQQQQPLQQQQPMQQQPMQQQLQGFVAQQWQPRSVHMMGSPAQLQQQPMQQQQQPLQQQQPMQQQQQPLQQQQPMQQLAGGMFHFPGLEYQQHGVAGIQQQQQRDVRHGSSSEHSPLPTECHPWPQAPGNLWQHAAGKASPAAATGFELPEASTQQAAEMVAAEGGSGGSNTSLGKRKGKGVSAFANPVAQDQLSHEMNKVCVKRAKQVAAAMIVVARGDAAAAAAAAAASASAAEAAQLGGHHHAPQLQAWWQAMQQAAARNAAVGLAAVADPAAAQHQQQHDAQGQQQQGPETSGMMELDSEAMGRLIAGIDAEHQHAQQQQQCGGGGLTDVPSELMLASSLMSPARGAVPRRSQQVGLAAMDSLRDGLHEAPDGSPLAAAAPGVSEGLQPTLGGSDLLTDLDSFQIMLPLVLGSGSSGDRSKSMLGSGSGGDRSKSAGGGADSSPTAAGLMPPVAAPTLGGGGGSSSNAGRLPVQPIREESRVGLSLASDDDDDDYGPFGRTPFAMPGAHEQLNAAMAAAAARHKGGGHIADGGNGDAHMPDNLAGVGAAQGSGSLGAAGAGGGPGQGTGPGTDQSNATGLGMSLGLGDASGPIVPGLLSAQQEQALGRVGSGGGGGGGLLSQHNSAVLMQDNGAVLRFAQLSDLLLEGHASQLPGSEL